MNWMARGLLSLAVTASVALSGLACEHTLAPEHVGYVGGLRSQRLIDDTLRKQVQEVVDVLVATSGTWARGLVNRDHDPDALNVYLVNPDAPGSANGPQELTGTRGTVRALPGRRTILADANYLAQIKAASELYSESLRQHDRSVSSYDVLALVMLEGPDPAVRSRVGERADWRAGTNELFQGAIAFLIAHEMGHVVAGLDPAASGSGRPPPGLGGPNSDRLWACATLVGEDVNARRAQEAEADSFAAALLVRIPHHSTLARRLRYEHGTVFLMNAELGKVVAALAALSPRRDSIVRMAGIALNPAIIDAMRDSLGRTAGMIETAFPPSHPAQVERLIEMAVRFSQNPKSAYYGDADDAKRLALWRLLIHNVCESINSNTNGRKAPR